MDGTLHRHATATQHFFQFDQAYPLNSGHSGSVPLYGTRLWFLSNVGSHLGKARLAWPILSFDPDVSAEQRNALSGVLRHPRWYRPERWKSCAFGTDAPIEWAANEHGARATLGSGQTAELSLSSMPGSHNQPVKISNLPYLAIHETAASSSCPVREWPIAERTTRSNSRMREPTAL